MSYIATVGQETLTLKIGTETHLFDSGADGDYIVVDNPNDDVVQTIGQNGNVIYTRNEQGRAVDLTLRVVNGSPADIFLINAGNQALSAMDNDVASFKFIGATITTFKSDGTSTKKITLQLINGVISKTPNWTVNAEGNASEAIHEYSLKFIKDNGRGWSIE